MVATIKPYTCPICKDETYKYLLSTEEEITLEMITSAFPTTTAFPTSFPGSPHTYQTSFYGNPHNFKRVFT